jgi:dTDP-glucose 4,6-dehydratase
MRVLVTGGTGFIGTNLVYELKKRNHEVWICDLLNHSIDNYVRCDISQMRQVEKIFDSNKFDYVYNLAAEYGRWNGEDYYENLWNTNVIGTKNIIRMQEKYHFKLIDFSSSEVYGDYEGVMSEDVMEKFEIKQMNDYAMTKWVNEMQVLNSADMYDTETVRVRPINCYGPFEHYTPYRGFVPKFIYCALFDKPYTVYTKHTRTIDYVEDTCRTFANIMDNFIPGEVYNVGGIKETSIKYISDYILDSLDKDDSLITYEDYEMQTTKKKVIDNSKAIKDLDHKPVTTPEDGISKTIEWFKKIYL